MSFSIQTARSAVANGGYFYLASPYSRYEGGLDCAAAVASRYAGRLIQLGLPIFCPVSHSHGISEESGIPHCDHETWMPLDRCFIEHAAGLIVLKMHGWDVSVGVQQEIEWFTAAGKPILFADLADIDRETSQ